MASNDGSKIGMLGVLIGAVIVVLVGGGILYATGALNPRPTTVTIQQPAPTPAPAVADRAERDDRRDDRRDDWRNERRDDRRGDRDDRRDRDGSDRR